MYQDLGLKCPSSWQILVMLSNDLLNGQSFESQNVLTRLGNPLRSKHHKHSQQNKQQAENQAFSLVVPKPADNALRDSMWTPSLHNPNTRLLFMRGSLTKQLMEPREPWIPPVSLFETYRIMRKTVRLAEPAGCAGEQAIFVFIFVCVVVTVTAGSRRRPWVSFPHVLLLPHRNSIMNSAMPLPFLLFCSAPEQAESSKVS